MALVGDLRVTRLLLGDCTLVVLFPAELLYKSRLQLHALMELDVVRMLVIQVLLEVRLDARLNRDEPRYEAAELLVLQVELPSSFYVHLT